MEVINMALINNKNTGKVIAAIEKKLQRPLTVKELYCILHGDNSVLSTKKEGKK
jgi:hypothetical protein